MKTTNINIFVPIKKVQSYVQEQLVSKVIRNVISVVRKLYWRIKQFLDFPNLFFPPIS